MITVNIKVSRTRIRCVDHWMPGWIIGLRLQCGVGGTQGTCIIISAYAPVHDERTQTLTSEAHQIEFWRELDGVIRQVPVWTPMEKWKQHFLGLEAQGAELVNGKNGPEMGTISWN